jgi:chromosomal replication initiation ATPase DnaA
LAQQFDHLTAITAELLHLSDDLRIREVQSERWVHYPRAKAALAAMDRLAAHPRTTRMPSLAIYGDSGMGKTMLMKKFCEFTLGSSIRARASSASRCCRAARKFC